MKFTPYIHFAAADFISVSILCSFALLALFGIGILCLKIWPYSEPYSTLDNFGEPVEDADFEETGIGCETANMAPGTQLVEIDTAGLLTPPADVWVCEYFWTGTEIKFVRRVPLHAFDFTVSSAALHAASHPDALAAREDFLSAHHRPLPPGAPVQL